jgi:hypothetical protein
MGPLVGCPLERVQDEHASHAVLRERRIPPRLVTREGGLPPEPVQHADDRLVSARHQGRGSSARARSLRKPAMEGELLDAEGAAASTGVSSSVQLEEAPQQPLVHAGRWDPFEADALTLEPPREAPQLTDEGP